VDIWQIVYSQKFKCLIVNLCLLPEIEQIKFTYEVFETQKNDEA
jgi:hypothetical protein